MSEESLVLKLKNDLAGLREDNERLQSLAMVAVATRDDAFKERDSLRSRLAASEREVERLSADAGRQFIELSKAVERATAAESRVAELERDRTIHACQCGDDEACALLRRAEGAESRVRELEGVLHLFAEQGPVECYGANTPTDLLRWCLDVRSKAQAVLYPNRHLCATCAKAGPRAVLTDCAADASVAVHSGSACIASCTGYVARAALATKEGP